MCSCQCQSVCARLCVCMLCVRVCGRVCAHGRQSSGGVKGIRRKGRVMRTSVPCHNPYKHRQTNSTPPPPHSPPTAGGKKHSNGTKTHKHTRTQAEAKQTVTVTSGIRGNRRLRGFWEDDMWKALARWVIALPVYVSALRERILSITQGSTVKRFPTRRHVAMAKPKREMSTACLPD